MKHKRQYYYQYDFYNMVSDEQLTIIPRFKARHGNIANTCGANAVLMVMNYYNDIFVSEEEVYDGIKTLSYHGAKIDYSYRF